MALYRGAAVIATVAGGLAAAVAAHAQTYVVDPTAQATLNSGVTGLGQGLVSEIEAVLPVALGVLVTLIAIVFGLRFAISLILRHKG